MTDIHEKLGLQTINFSSQSEFHQHLIAAIRQTQRTLWLADHDFSQWPLNKVEVATALQDFLRASRANSIRLLVAAPECLAGQMPRFMHLLRLHSHSIQCRIPPDSVIHRFSETCSFLVADQIRLVRRFQRGNMRGVDEQQPAAVNLWAKQFLAVWEESETALSSTILGLGG